MSVMGLKNIEVKLAKHKRATVKGLRAGLLRGGLFLQRESQLRVPVEYGPLKASANTRIEGDGMDSAVIVSYGTEYAVIQHEELNFRHQPGQTAKYLETPLREKRARIAEIVTDAIREFQE